MKVKEAMIAWNPGGDVGIGPVTNGEGAAAWHRKYRCTIGACLARTKKLTKTEAIGQLFIDFHTLVVRDGVDPQKAHQAFLVIDEYRERISPDTPGAA